MIELLHGTMWAGGRVNSKKVGERKAVYNKKLLLMLLLFNLFNLTWLELGGVNKRLPLERLGNKLVR